jgi:hypothetical protein
VLHALVPTGRMAILAQPFVLPVPAFGPGSVEHTRQQAEGLEVRDECSLNGVGAKYAGAGAYY